uniref:Uncharacterized protein n=1 Tax=Glossina pallidipes TaxID=7398 RepID=A0A1B0AAA1_GLOPL
MNRSSKRRQCFSRKLLNQRISFNKGRDKANTLEDNIVLPTNGFSSSELENTDFIPSEQMFETFVFGSLASLASVVDDIKNKFVTFDLSVDILLASVEDIIGIVEVDFAMLSFNFACNFGVCVIFWELWFSPFSRSVVLLLYLEHLLNDTLTPHMFRLGETRHIRFAGLFIRHKHLEEISRKVFKIIKHLVNVR